MGRLRPDHESKVDVNSMSVTSSPISLAATLMNRPSGEGERMECGKSTPSSYLCRESTIVASLDPRRVAELWPELKSFCSH